LPSDDPQVRGIFDGGARAARRVQQESGPSGKPVMRVMQPKLGAAAAPSGRRVIRRSRA